MKISSDYLKAYRQSMENTPKGLGKKEKVPEKLQVEDRLSLSDRAQEVRAVKELARQVPEVRWEKVKDLQQRITAGTYDFSPEKTAELILPEIDKLL